MHRSPRTLASIQRSRSTLASVIMPSLLLRGATAHRCRCGMGLVSERGHTGPPSALHTPMLAPRTTGAHLQLLRRCRVAAASDGPHDPSSAAPSASTAPLGTMPAVTTAGQDHASVTINAAAPTASSSSSPAPARPVRRRAVARSEASGKGSTTTSSTSTSAGGMSSLLMPAAAVVAGATILVLLYRQYFASRVQDASIAVTQVWKGVLRSGRAVKARTGCHGRVVQGNR